MLNHSAKGQQASVARVPGAGHLVIPLDTVNGRSIVLTSVRVQVVQTKPRTLAEEIYVALRSDVASNFAQGPARSTGAHSKL